MIRGTTLIPAIRQALGMRNVHVRHSSTCILSSVQRGSSGVKFRIGI